jgi:hypothetical protein
MARFFSPLCLPVASLMMWGALSDERTDLPITMYNIFTFYMLLHECICTILFDLIIIILIINQNQIIGGTPTEKMEKIQLIGSSSPYESNRAIPTGGRRPFPFMRDFMGLSLSLSYAQYMHGQFRLSTADHALSLVASA